VYLMKNHTAKDIGEFINIGTGTDMRIKDMANLVKDIIGYQGSIIHDLSKPDGTPKKLLDVTRLRTFGWEAKTGLEEGIRKTSAFYRSMAQ